MVAGLGGFVGFVVVFIMVWFGLVFNSGKKLPLQVIWLILKDKVKMRDPNQLLVHDFIARERDSMLCET